LRTRKRACCDGGGVEDLKVNHKWSAAFSRAKRYSYFDYFDSFDDERALLVVCAVEIVVVFEEG
jgi:hypothetical protein